MAAVWVSLAVLLASLAGGAWHVFVRARDAVRAFRELGGAVTDALARVDEAAARVSQAASRAPGTGPELAPSVDRLDRSRARLSVLTGAIGETTSFGRSVRGLVPRK